MPASLSSMPLAAMTSTTVTTGGWSPSVCDHPSETAHEVEQVAITVSGTAGAPHDILSAAASPDAACTALPSQQALEKAAVIARCMLAAVRAVIDEDAVPPEDPDPGGSHEDADTPYSMSHAELCSLRNRLEVGLAEWALNTRCTNLVLRLENRQLCLGPVPQSSPSKMFPSNLSVATKNASHCLCSCTPP